MLYNSTVSNSLFRGRKLFSDFLVWSFNDQSFLLFVLFLFVVCMYMLYTPSYVQVRVQSKTCCYNYLRKICFVLINNFNSWILLVTCTNRLYSDSDDDNGNAESTTFGSAPQMSKSEIDRFRHVFFITGLFRIV